MMNRMRCTYSGESSHHSTLIIAFFWRAMAMRQWTFSTSAALI